MEAIGAFVVGVVISIVLSLMFSLPVMWLWDWLMPTLFQLPTITWLQAWGLNFLCGLLFKSHNISTKD